MKLSKLAVDRAALEKRIEFHFLKSSRCSQALLVARGCIPGRRLSFSLRLGAFENNNIAWHILGGGARRLDQSLPSSSETDAHPTQGPCIRENRDGDTDPIKLINRE